MKGLSVLGSTGSIGVSTLDLIERFPGRFEVVARNMRENFEQTAGHVGLTVEAAVYERVRQLTETGNQNENSGSDELDLFGSGYSCACAAADGGGCRKQSGARQVVRFQLLDIRKVSRRGEHAACRKRRRRRPGVRRD